MIKYLSTHPWSIVEEDFHADLQRSSESIFSIGNGKFGQRANHEEAFSGKTLQGSYVAGVYYPEHYGIAKHPIFNKLPADARRYD